MGASRPDEIQVYFLPILFQNHCHISEELIFIESEQVIWLGFSLCCSLLPDVIQGLFEVEVATTLGQ